MTSQNPNEFKLPVLQIWREAYGFVFSVPQRVLIAGILPFGLYFAAWFFIQTNFVNPASVSFYETAMTMTELDPDPSDAEMTEFLETMPAFLAEGVVVFGWIAVLAVLGGLAGASMAAAWHRTTLIGLDADRTGFGLFIGGPERRYFLRAVLMVIITVAALLAYSIIASIVFGILVGALSIAAGGAGAAVLPIVIVVLLGVGGFLLWLYLWAKLVMCLPAAALGINNFGIGEAWSATKGHEGRLMAVYAGLLIPLALVSFAVSWVIEMNFGYADPAAPTVAELDRVVAISLLPTLIISIFSTALIASGMSYSYYRLGRPPEWVEKVF